jgi:hypothetical protein
VDFLRGLAGTFTSSVLRLAVTAGTLALIYFFVIKPVLDTTEEVSRSTRGFSNSTQTDISRQIQRSIRQANRQVQRSINRSFNQTPSTKGQQHLLRCVQRAQGNVNRIQACGRKF